MLVSYHVSKPLITWYFLLASLLLSYLPLPAASLLLLCNNFVFNQMNV